jgi:hypothetical protein
MSKYRHDDFEVYGFEGTALIECELVLPVLRQVATDKFLKGALEDITGESHALFTRGEIERLAEERELTILPAARPCVPRARVLYVTADFLANVTEQPPHRSYWQELEPMVWAACAPEQDLRALMDDWARKLIVGSTNALVRFLHSHEEDLRDEAERLAEFALCAGSHASLRASTYFRYGLAITESSTPERLQHFFEMFIQPEFTNWTWETFLEDLRRFKYTLRIREPARAISVKATSTAAARDMVSASLRDEEVRGTVEEILQEVERVSRISEPQERVLAAFQAADLYRSLFSVTEEAVNRVARRIHDNEVFRMKDGGEDLQVFAGEPAFYYDPSYSMLGDGVVVKGMDFFKVVQRFINQTKDVQRRGPITDWIINRIEENRKSGRATRVAGQQAGSLYVPR